MVVNKSKHKLLKYGNFMCSATLTVLVGIAVGSQSDIVNADVTKDKLEVNSTQVETGQVESSDTQISSQKNEPSSNSSDAAAISINDTSTGKTTSSLSNDAQSSAESTSVNDKSANISDSSVSSVTDISGHPQSTTDTSEVKQTPNDVIKSNKQVIGVEQKANATDNKKPVQSVSANKVTRASQPVKPNVQPKNGFLTENGITKYYNNGQFVTGERKINNSWYHFESEGKQSIGLTKLARKTVYYNNNGQMHYGYLKTNSTYMFFDLFDGHAFTGLRRYNKGLEYYGNDFKQVRNNYVKTGNTYYYFGGNGDAIKGQRWYAKGLEFYDQNYKQLRNSYAKTGNTYYYLGANGDAIKGFRKYRQTGLEYYGNDYRQYRNRSFKDSRLNSYHVNSVGDVDNVNLRHKWYSQLNQGYPEGCEATALQIALSNKNKYYSLPTIYNATGYGYNKNPSTGFYGNPKGWGSSLTETVFASRLASSMQKYDRGISNLTGASVNDVISEVLNGNPVVTWGDYYWQLGRSFHVMTIVGYHNGKFRISDPYAYSQREYDVSTSAWHDVNSKNYALGWRTPSAMNVVVRS